jgi:hypothetical protein
MNNKYLVSQVDKNGVKWNELVQGGILVGSFPNIVIH